MGKINNFTIAADMHTHTLASDHAFSTSLELITYAKMRGIKMIAITDHAPGQEDAPLIGHFSSMNINMPKKVDGVYVVPGIEANIMDHDGNVDVSEKVLKSMPWVIASYHIDCVAPGTIEDHTRAYLNIAQNPYIDVIGHSSTPEYRYDYEKCILAFKEHNKLVEINNHVFDYKPESAGNCKEIALLCKKHEVPIVVSTDAHICFQVGSVDHAAKMLSEIDFPPHLLVNREVGPVIARIKEKRGIDYSAL